MPAAYLMCSSDIFLLLSSRMRPISPLGLILFYSNCYKSAFFFVPKREDDAMKVNAQGEQRVKSFRHKKYEICARQKEKFPRCLGNKTKMETLNSIINLCFFSVLSCV
jgi:hypothetical protein